MKKMILRAILTTVFLLTSVQANADITQDESEFYVHVLAFSDDDSLKTTVELLTKKHLRKIEDVVVVDNSSDFSIVFNCANVKIKENDDYVFCASAFTKSEEPGPNNSVTDQQFMDLLIFTTKGYSGIEKQTAIVVDYFNGEGLSTIRDYYKRKGL